MQESYLDLIKSEFDLPSVDIRTYSPLALAYIGDSVFDIIIRTIIVGQGNSSSHDLHIQVAKYVNAGTQASMIEALLPLLSEEELSIYKRGRNAKTATTAKNATIQDYRKATGFEALVGYLYLNSQMARILELMKMGIYKKTSK
ncbi:MAG: ribonuclease III [Lachnospiraceae bacterium]|nr:ribonuclease III [Lachnospiraceae bacterium]